MELKQISKPGVPAALQKAEKYRLLNEPEQAESICLDILAVEPEHQAALVTLLLALTDQFVAGETGRVRQAEATLVGLVDEYARVYYGGIVRERWARALLAAGDAGRQALAWLEDAMAQYERAESLAPAGNDEAILRWNACARTIAHDRLEREDAGLQLIDAGDSAPHRRCGARFGLVSAGSAPYRATVAHSTRALVLSGALPLMQSAARHTLTPTPTFG
jgi:hypothetical protein